MGSRDTLPGDLVNFRKRQKVAEIIIEVKQWQLQPHYFHPIESVLKFIEELMKSCSKHPDMGERVWNSNLKQDLQQDEEKMIHLLQESGI
jgi:son of sevenless-like protein